MSNQVWGLPSGLPTGHAIRSAILVARVLGADGALEVDAYESYWRTAGGGVYAPPDMQLGQQLLIDVDLVRRRGPNLVPAPDLAPMLAGETAEELIEALCVRALDITPPSDMQKMSLDPELAALLKDPARVLEVLHHARMRFDDQHRRAVGSIGEELAMKAARAELVSLGCDHLADRVRQVSLYDDSRGFDIAAPRLDESMRLIEVKATASDSDPIVIHLTRNESDVSSREPLWSVAVCLVESVEQRTGVVLGWLPSHAFVDLLPLDRLGATWEVARLGER